MTNKYLGAIHIHTTLSDGTGDVREIALAAKNAGLDWIIITDHNNFEVEEGFIEGVCVIKGEEISPSDNHYLALGIKEVISENRSVQDYVNEVRAQGGFGFAAHPDENNTRKNNNRPIKWLNKNIIPDGVEIWNWFSTWADNYSDKNLFTLIYAYLFKHKLIKKAKWETLKWWDDLNLKSEKIIPAIGGVDAHALKVKKYIIPVTIFPYQEVFKTITNVITLENGLSTDFETAKTQILNEIKCGRNLIVNRKLTTRLPEITISQVANSETDTGMIALIRLEKAFDVKILCNGEVFWSKKTKNAQVELTKSGKYRIEVCKGELGYAYTNPVMVKI